MTTQQPLTDQQLDEIVTMPSAEDIDTLVAEVRRLRAERDEFCNRVDTLTAVAKGNKRHVQDMFLELQKAQARVAELEQPPAIAALEQAFAAEVNDDRALTMLDALIILRSELPCTCARSQGLHEKGCRRYVAGHDLLSPARRLARARDEMPHAAARPAGAAASEDTVVTEPGISHRPCGHDDYHDSHEWADRPGMWCPGISYADDEPAAAGSAAANEEQR